MVNFLFEPGWTYAELAARSQERWDRYAEAPAEDPNEPWREGMMRLRDFGIPDFTEIAPPKIEDGTLVYFARALFNGLPYRTKVTLGRVGDVTYLPLELTPPPEPSPPVPDPVATMPGEDDDDSDILDLDAIEDDDTP